MERIGLAPGSEVGGYTIVAPLGSGGMGTVYRALDGGGSPVALKLLHPHIGADPVSRERLRREVLALQKLRHPGVAAVLDAEADSTEAFLVTELVAGENVEDHVRARGPLDADDLADLASGLHDALTAVHAAGVVHRDLKPSNVLLTHDGPVLIDFGIAQAADDTHMTSTGFVVGTPGYLAPELLDGADPTATSDWWGWAALLCFAATGRAPFGTRPLEAVLVRARSGEPDLAGVGPVTAAALRAALAADPHGRLGAVQVVAELRRAAADGDEPAEDEDADGIGTAVLGGATVVLPGGTEVLVPVAGATALVPPPVVEPVVVDGPGETRVWPTGGAGTAGPAGAGLDDDGLGSALGPDDIEGGPDDDEPAYERPPARRRWGSVASLALLTVAASTLYPGWTLVALGVALVLVRTVGETVEAMHDRRELAGVRRSDTARAVLTSPWHLLRSLAGLLPSVLVGASVVVIALGVTWWLVGTDRWSIGTATGEPTGPVASGLVAGSVLLGLVALWWGPISVTTRIGTRRLLGTLAPGGAGALVVVVLALVATAVLVALLLTGSQIVWWPLPEPSLP
ncbi:protein kinase domain-containing protein [Cellulomonas hominis]